ncbi:MAG: hypothetical protein WCD70_09375 [Alphaproteobacteria bacterium]
MSQETWKITDEWVEQANKLLAVGHSQLELHVCRLALSVDIRNLADAFGWDKSKAAQEIKADLVALKAQADFDFFGTHWQTAGTPETEPQRKFVAEVIDQANKLLAPKVA